MGEIAEMMLDGTLCERCGEFIGEPCGYPRYCEDCASDEVEDCIEEIEYDFNFNKVGIEKLTFQILEVGTKKQKKAILKILYKLVNQTKRRIEDEK